MSSRTSKNIKALIPLSHLLRNEGMAGKVTIITTCPLSFYLLRYMIVLKGLGFRHHVLATSGIVVCQAHNIIIGYRRQFTCESADYWQQVDPVCGTFESQTRCQKLAGSFVCILLQERIYIQISHPVGRLAQHPKQTPSFPFQPG